MHRYLCYLLLVLPWLCINCSIFAPILDPVVQQDEFIVQASKSEKNDSGPPPIAVTIRFHGGKDIGRRKLMDRIMDSMLDLSRNPDRRGSAYDAMLDVQDSIRSQGYPLAKVEHSQSKLPKTNDILVEFTLHLGPLCTVKDLRLLGRQQLSEEELLQFWSRKQQGFLGLDDPLYVEAGLQGLVTSMQSYYMSKGFLDAKVSLLPPEPKPEQESQAKKLGLVVSIQIEEGHPYHFGQTELNDKLAGTLHHLAPMPPQPGDAFSRKSIESYRLQLFNQLRNLGYNEPKLNLRVTVNPEKHLVDSKVQGDPGQQVSIAEIVVRGNLYVSSNRILELMRIHPGETFHGLSEENSLLRLYQTGLFRKAEIQHEPMPENKIRLVIQVEEIERYLLEPEIGYGSYEQLRGGIGFQMRHLQFLDPLFIFDLDSRAMVSRRGHRVVTSLTDPNVLSSDTAFSVQAELRRREEPSFTDESLGFSTSLSRPLFSPRTLGRIGYTFKEHRDGNVDVVDPAAGITDYTEANSFAEISRDQRDNVLMPRSGYRWATGVQWLDPALGGSISLTHLRAGFTYYQPLFGKSAQVVLNAQSAWLFPGEGSDAVPISQRLFNGGENSVRSFDESELSPLDINGDPVGGDYRNIFNLELRWQAFKFLELAGFADAGNTGSKVQDYDLRDMRYAVGGGLRVLTPIGPLRFDAAHNPDRMPKEEDWILHFSIGYPF